MGAEHHRKRKGTVQPGQDGCNRIARRLTLFDFAGDQMRDNFRIGLAEETPALCQQFVAQWLEILDNSVVYDDNITGDMRVGIVLGRGPMRRPAGVGNACISGQGVILQSRREIDQLALSPATVEIAAMNGTDSGRIIAPVFQPFQPAQQAVRHRITTQNADDSTHKPIRLNMLCDCPCHSLSRLESQDDLSCDVFYSDSAFNSSSVRSSRRENARPIRLSRSGCRARRPARRGRHPW